MHGGSETLLVVEDEDAVLKSQVEFLPAIGYTVLSATNGRDALEQVRARTSAIDLVITDVVMPQMSGPKLAENLASLPPDLMVLRVSGYADDTVFGRAMPISAGTACRSRSRCIRWPRNIREVLEQPPGVRVQCSGTGVMAGLSYNCFPRWDFHHRATIRAPAFNMPPCRHTRRTFAPPRWA